MKKTLVAASIAALVAAPAAFADVKVSGFIVQEFVNDGDDTNGTDKDGLESHSETSVFVSGSEDLGNGMKASFKIDLSGDDGTAGRGGQTVALSGDFGTVTVGRMESLTESKTFSAMNMDSADSMTVEPMADHDYGTADGGIAYMSPNMNGFQVGVACGAEQSASYSTTNGADDKCDVTDIYASYSNAGMTLQVSQLEVNKSVTGGANDEKTLGAALTYKMGATTLIAGYGEMDDLDGVATDDADATMIGVKHTMGNNTIALGMTNEEKKVSGTATDTDTMILDFAHNLSKSTKLFVTYQDKEVDVAGTTTGDSNKDSYAIGVKHSF